MEARVSTGLTAAEGRRFGLTVGGAFAALALLLWWRDRPNGAAVLGVIGGVLLLAGLLLPAFLGPVQRVWMRMARGLSKVTTPVFMGVVYFVLFTVTGWLMRLAGRNPLVRPAGNPGFWVGRAGSRDRRSNDMERQF